MSGGNIAGFNSILFDFDSIVDIKLGFIKYMKLNLHLFDENLINVDFINKPDYFFKNFHVNTFKDIIKECFIDKIKNSANNIYNEILEEEYNVIIQLSPNTAMVRLINTYNFAAEGAVKCTILCKNEPEKQYIRTIFPDINIIQSKRKDVSISDYAKIVLAYTDHSLEFTNPKARIFMFLNYKENFMENIPNQINLDIIERLGDVNIFTYCNAYIDKELEEDLKK